MFCNMSYFGNSLKAQLVDDTAVIQKFKTFNAHGT